METKDIDSKLERMETALVAALLYGVTLLVESDHRPRSVGARVYLMNRRFDP